jgi:hypothetical protein
VNGLIIEGRFVGYSFEYNEKEAGEIELLDVTVDECNFEYLKKCF